MGRGGNQLVGKLLVERVGVGIADENPDEAEALLGRDCLHRDGSADAAVGAIGDVGAQFAVAEPVGPAVIRAADGVREFLYALRQLPAALRAATAKRERLTLPLAQRPEVYCHTTNPRPLL